LKTPSVFLIIFKVTLKSREIRLDGEALQTLKQRKLPSRVERGAFQGLDFTSPSRLAARKIGIFEWASIRDMAKSEKHLLRSYSPGVAVTA
jgi:hypothetical protein